MKKKFLKRLPLAGAVAICSLQMAQVSAQPVIGNLLGGSGPLLSVSVLGGQAASLEVVSGGTLVDLSVAGQGLALPPGGANPLQPVLDQVTGGLGGANPLQPVLDQLGGLGGGANPLDPVLGQLPGLGGGANPLQPVIDQLTSLAAGGNPLGSLPGLPGAGGNPLQPVIDQLTSLAAGGNPLGSLPLPGAGGNPLQPVIDQLTSLAAGGNPLGSLPLPGAGGNPLQPVIDQLTALAAGGNPLGSLPGLPGAGGNPLQPVIDQLTALAAGGNPLGSLPLPGGAAPSLSSVVNPLTATVDSVAGATIGAVGNAEVVDAATDLVDGVAAVVDQQGDPASLLGDSLALAISVQQTVEGAASSLQGVVPAGGNPLAPVLDQVTSQLPSGTPLDPVLAQLPL